MDSLKCIRRVLAHGRMDFRLDTYGECRDSERPKASNLSAWLIAKRPCVDSLECIRRVLAHGRMDFRLDTYGECRDSERPKASNLSAWLIAKRRQT